MYKPGQPNWELTMWKFQDFSTTQILREINFGHFEAQKTAIWTIWAALDFEFLGTLTLSNVKFFQKSKFEASKIVKTEVFDLLKSAKIDFTQNQSRRVIAKFQHCGWFTDKIPN